MTDLNKRERAILKFIEKQINEKGYPPSVREIGKAVGLSSTATVHGYLAKLTKKGYIKKEDQKGRTLRVLKGGLADNEKPSPKPLYNGRELVDVPVTGILDGDYILVKRQNSARNGQIVVALIEDEATVKTFYKEKDYIRLQPENSTMDPIIVPDCKILGVVGGVFRKL